MNLTMEQLYDIHAALRYGWSAAAWEGVTDRPWTELSDEEKIAVLAAVRSATEEKIQHLNLSPTTANLSQPFLDRMNLASVQREERLEHENRENFLNLPSGKRGTPSGRRQAINDLLAQSHFFDVRQRRAVERRLAARNLPSLTMLKALLRRQHEKILKRGKIRTDEEFYLVKEVLDSVDFPIDEDKRQRLAFIVADFETRHLSG